MPWLKLDDGFAEHPKVAALSDRAFRVHVQALGYAARNLTDGHIPQPIALSISYGKKTPITELVKSGVWEQNGQAGYILHDYLDYNPSKTEVLEQRKKRSQAGKKGADTRWHDEPDIT